MSNNKLFVGNLAFSVTDEALGEFFKQSGGVVSSRVIRDKVTGRSKGFGFVEMESSAAAEGAAGLNGQSLEGRAITVAEAKAEGAGGGGGGGFRSGGGGGGGFRSGGGGGGGFGGGGGGGGGGFRRGGGGGGGGFRRGGGGFGESGSF